MGVWFLIRRGMVSFASKGFWVSRNGVREEPWNSDLAERRGCLRKQKCWIFSLLCHEKPTFSQKRLCCISKPKSQSDCDQRRDAYREFKGG